MNLTEATRLAKSPNLNEREGGVGVLLSMASGLSGTVFEQARARQVLRNDLPGVSVELCEASKINA